MNSLSAVLKKRLSHPDPKLVLMIRTLLMIAALWGCLNFIFGLAILRGDSMAPVIQDGDVVCFFRAGLTLRSGDTIVFTADKKDQAGIITACPGDTVSFDEDGLLHINGSNDVVSENEIQDPDTRAAFPVAFTLAPDQYYIRIGQDTRSDEEPAYRTVSRGQISGKIIGLYRHRLL